MKLAFPQKVTAPFSYNYHQLHMDNPDNMTTRRASRPFRRRRPPVNRTHRACVSCKEKKLKCDEQTSGCANCERLNLTCLIEDPQTKKKQPRNYLKTIEERLAILEGRRTHDYSTPNALMSNSNIVTPDTSLSSPQDPISRHNDGQWSAALTPRHACDDQESDKTIDLSNKLGLLDVQTSQGESQYLGSSSSFSFAHIVNASLQGAVPMQFPGNEDAESTDARHHDAPRPVPCVLPSYQAAIALSNSYFENIHPQYPFLHEPTFRRHEAQLFKLPVRGSRDTQPSAVPLFFVNMVYAVAALLAPGTQQLAEGLYASAQLHSQVLALNNIESIQAILLHAMFSLRSAKGPSLWKLSGFALRQCIELGYHRSTKRFGRGQTALQLEMRKRVFWCAQNIDAVCALRLGRPMGIQIHEIDAELPMDIDDDQMDTDGIHGTPRPPTALEAAPTKMSNAVHVIRLRHIWARIHTCIYSANALGDIDEETRMSHIAQLRRDLDEWLATTPKVLPRIGKTLTIFSTPEWYELNYSGSILYLYRHQLASSESTPDDIFMDCVKAASNVCHTYRRQYIGTSIRYTWGTLHCIFLAGLTYLHCLWTSMAVRDRVPYSEVSKTCTDCTMVLVVIAEGWEGAGPYRDIFDVLANRTISMVLSKGTLTQHGSSPSPAMADDTDRDNLAGWIADIDKTCMLDVYDPLLSGFTDDFSIYGHFDTAV